VAVKIENVGEKPVAIGRVWVFSDFDAFFKGAGMTVPYRIAPTVHLNWGDMEGDIRRVERIKEGLDGANVKGAWTTWIGYAKEDEKVVEGEIDYVLAVAKKAKMPVQICFDSWWENTPHEVGGKNWWEEKYQQVVWDETEKRMRLSTPNRWGNTPWLTMSNVELNEFKARRLREAARYLGKHYREMGRDEGLVLAVNLENEPAYWASGAAGLGEDLLWADFNPAAVEAARRVGVMLDPRDGLSVDERRWLAGNLLAYQRLILTAAAGGLWEGGGGELAENVYTQGMVSAVYNEFPRVDRVWPGWESAAPAGARVGGEWNSDSLRERECVLLQIALGRTANVNAECGNDARAVSGVAAGYALGQRFYTPYNYPLGEVEQLAETVKDVSVAYAEPTYRRGILVTDFADAKWEEQVALTENVVVGRLSNTPMQVVHVRGGGKPGILRYELKAPTGGFKGLGVELTGRANDFVDHRAEVCLRVWAGRDEKSLRLMRTFANMEHIDAMEEVDLSEVARGAGRVVVQLELATPGMEEGLLDWVALARVRFVTPWVEEMAQQEETLESAREHHLLVSWRADVELAMQGLKPGTQKLEEARAAYARGEYARAYQMARLP
jgi:hypothetical protein